MKVVLVVLILGFFISLTSAFLWSNQQPKTQRRTPVSTHRSTVYQQKKQLHNGTHPVRQPVAALNKNHTQNLPLQRVLNRRRNPIRNATAVQRQADTIQKMSTQIIPQNRFRAIVYQQQQQHRALNNPSVSHQTNRTHNITNKQIVHSRTGSVPPKNKANITSINAANRRAFLAALFSSSDMAYSKRNGSAIVKNKSQRSTSRLLPGKTAVSNAKFSLLRALTTTATNNKGNLPAQRSLADRYREEQLKAYIRYSNEQNAAAQNRALKKRWAQSEIPQSDAVYPMVLVRDQSSDTEN